MVCLSAVSCSMSQKLTQRAQRFQLTLAHCFHLWSQQLSEPFVRPLQVSNPVRYPELLDHGDLGLDGDAGYGDYALSSVMSHLGHANEGHFITHRVSWFFQPQAFHQP